MKTPKTFLRLNATSIGKYLYLFLLSLSLFSVAFLPSRYIEKVNASHATMNWTEDGLLLANGLNVGGIQSESKILPDGSGGLILAWTDH